MTEVVFVSPTKFDSLGRNGCITTSGVFLEVVGDEVLIEPRTGRGMRGRSRIVVPVSHIDKVISVLASFKRLHRLMKARSIELCHLTKLDEHCLETVAIVLWSKLTPAAREFLLAHQCVNVSGVALRQHQKSELATAA